MVPPQLRWKKTSAGRPRAHRTQPLRGFDGGADALGRRAAEQALAMGGVTEIVALGAVAARVDAGEGADGDGHGLERGGRSENAGLAVERGGGVVFEIESLNRAAATGLAPANLHGGRASREGQAEDQRKCPLAHRSAKIRACSAASPPPVPPGTRTAKTMPSPAFLTAPFSARPAGEERGSVAGASR